MDREYDEVGSVDHELTLDVLMRLAERLRAPPAPPVIIAQTPFGGQSIIATWLDELNSQPLVAPRWIFIENPPAPRQPARRSASARKRKAARYWR